MSTDLPALLRLALADPAKLDALAPEQKQALVVALKAAGVIEQKLDGPAPPVAPAPGSGESDLLTVGEAAAVLKVSVRWLYRHARALPFARRLSRKTLRFSRSGIARWLATKRYDQARPAR